MQSRSEGTTFTIYFPATRRAKKQEPAARSNNTLDKYKGNGETVLVVDDVAEQREIAVSILKQLKYNAFAVPSGEEAIQAIRNNHVDLVILDMVMDPGLDGLETYRRILELKPGQKALIASGYSLSKKVREAQRLGAGPFIKKPYLMETLAQAVKEALGR